MSNDIDIGQFSEVVNNKMDRNMANQDSNIHHIISTYVNGTSGYRIWDDGYCEQWGKRLKSAGATITLLKTFADTNFNVLLQHTGINSSSTVQWRYMCSGTVTTSSIELYNIGSNDYDTYWKVSGYLASGQY